VSDKKRDDRDSLEIIQDGLNAYGGPQKSAGEWRMICCPFHNDKTPSCGVYTRRGGRAPLGWFNCLGCGTKGHWNVLAEKIKAPKIKEWDSKEKSVEGAVLSEADEDKLLGGQTLTVRRVLKIMQCQEAQPWPDYLPWRGFDGKLIAQVGGMIINDYHNDNVAVLFPVRVAGRVQGAVKAIYEKKRQGQLSYITMPGEWVNSYGLFLFEFAKKLIEKRGFDFVVLVEGPRDALRLLRLGIPAIAVLGANTIGRTKALYISSLNVGTFYVMPDNDNGGSALWSNLKVALGKKKIVPKRLKLPREYDSNGKLIKMDPFSAPRAVISNLKELLTKRHGWYSEGIEDIRIRKS